MLRYKSKKIIGTMMNTHIQCDGVRYQAGKKKHIFFVVSAMGDGGAERVAALLCNYWVAQGYEVTLMPTFSGRGDCVYPLDDRVYLEYLADRVGGARKTIGSMPRRFWALRRAIKESGADVVVSFLSQVNIVTLLASLGLTVPVVVSERTYPPAMPLGLAWETLRRLTYPWAKTVVVQTEDAAKWFAKNCPAARVSVIANPVVFPLPVTDDIKRPAQWLGKNRHMVLAVGRLGEEKGFGQLLQAFALLANDYPTWELVVLGEGEQRERLERELEMLGMGGRVHLPGWVGNLPDWYHRAELYVMSSRFEGFPNALVEAMSHGLPSVSFDCNTGPRDIIRPGVDGVLVTPEQGAKGLAAAMGRLMGDQFLRVRMGKAASEVCERFALERIGSLWDKVFGFVK